MRVIVIAWAAIICVALIKNKKKGGVLEWIFILAGVLSSIQLLTGVR